MKVIWFLILSFFIFILLKGCEKRDEEIAEESAIKAAKEAQDQAEREVNNKKIDLIFAGERQIISKLKDGSSASFSNVFISTSDFVCGEVNSKNSFGGYVGFQRFISAYPTGISALEEGTNKRDFKKTWDKFCEYKTSTAYSRSEHNH